MAATGTTGTPTGTPTGTATISVAGALCVAHKTHRPRPTYLELHHVIPQAWQRFHDPGGLWDRRTAALCRTGHGNVHWYLVRYMHAYRALVLDAGPENLTAIQQARRTALAAVRDEVGGVDVAASRIAEEGMVRWQEAGLSLLALTEAGLWGEI